MRVVWGLLYEILGLHLGFRVLLGDLGDHWGLLVYSLGAYGTLMESKLP